MSRCREAPDRQGPLSLRSLSQGLQGSLLPQHRPRENPDLPFLRHIWAMSRWVCRVWLLWVPPRPVAVQPPTLCWTRRGWRAPGFPRIPAKCPQSCLVQTPQKRGSLETPAAMRPPHPSSISRAAREQSRCGQRAHHRHPSPVGRLMTDVNLLLASPHLSRGVLSMHVPEGDAREH